MLCNGFHAALPQLTRRSLRSLVRVVYIIHGDADGASIHSGASSGDVAVTVATTGQQQWAPDLLVRSKFAMNQGAVSTSLPTTCCDMVPVHLTHATPLKHNKAQLGCITAIGTCGNFTEIRKYQHTAAHAKVR